MFSVRQYQESDHDAVWNLHNLALHAVKAHVGNGPWDDDLHNIDTIYAKNKGVFLVLIQNDTIFAMGALKKLSDSEAQITRMRVHPNHQKRGLGQIILTALEGKARELGYQMLRLDTTTKQIAAQALYKKNGYVLTGHKELWSFEVISYQKTITQADIC
jgi:ribosomal protein S18 acetylase RimI-like enzyme